MSNFGQGLAAVAGGVIGFWIGGPTGAAYGFQLGLMAGTALFPTQLPGVSGPRLEDQRTTTSEVGAPVPIVYGTFAVAGQVIYLGELEEVETTEDVGGKGSPSQESTTYTYFQPIAIGLCEGPIDGILRIWENGELVYDVREGSDFDEGDSPPPPTDFGGFIGQAIRGVVAVTRTYQETFTLYTGTETQEPDPTIEADIGVGETPAFRGLAYVVYNRRQLQATQGLRHPNFKFEVVRNGEFECIDTYEYSNEQLHDWNTIGLPYNPNNTNQFTTSEISTADFSEALEAVRAEVTYEPNGPWQQIVYIGSRNFSGPIAEVDVLGGSSMANQSSTQALMYFGNVLPSVYVPSFENGVPVEYVGDDVCLVFGSEIGTVKFSSQFGLSMTIATPAFISSPLPAPPSGTVYENAARCGSGLGYWWVYTLARTIQVERSPGTPLDPCEGQPNATVSGFCVIDGQLRARGEWELVDAADLGEESFIVLQAFHPGLGDIYDDVTRYPLNPTRPKNHADDNEAFWTAAYNAAVASGDMQPGMTYASDGDGDGIATYPQTQSYGYIRPSIQCIGDSTGISLAEVVQDICARAGVTRVDVTELVPKMIIGYAVTRVMPARSALEPLKCVGLFDVVESPPELAFRVRGRAVSVTFGQYNLGAADDGTAPPPIITTKKLQDVELPRSVRVHYISPARDYEANEQPSPTRITTEAQNDVDVEIPVCLDDTEAKRIAEVLWADAWRSRWVHEFSTDQRYIALEPADIVLTPIDGVLERLRITNIDDTIPMLRKYEACRDDDGSYVSVAVADPPARPPNVIIVLAPSELILLDLPALRTSDNDAGVYGAVRSLMPDGQWNGAVVRYSVNGGESFQDLATTMAEAVIGRVVTPMGEGITTTWDDANTLVVDLLSGSLSNRTEAEIIELMNAAAVGVNGRFEMMQFTTATEISPDRWELTHLLRGRRGTEHYVGTGEVDDVFVLVSGPGVVRIPLDATEIGVPRIYKVVSIGATPDTGNEQTFTTDGVALIPYSPVYIEAPIDIDGNMDITWIRRGRLGHELTPGADIPLSEAYERYDLEICEPDGTVLRTVTVDEPEYEYLYDDQLTDLGARDQPMLIRVYQISDIKGRGTVGEYLTSSSPEVDT